MNKTVLVVSLALGIPGCALALQAARSEPHTVSGRELNALNAVAQAEQIDREDLAEYDFVVVEQDNGSLEIGVDRFRVATPPNEKMQGAPGGRAKVYVVSEDGSIIRHYYAR